MPGDLVGCFQVGLQRRLFDVTLPGGAARVDVDGDQRLSLVEHDITAGAQLNRRGVDAVELAFHLKVVEQWYPAIAERLHPARMAGHQHLHEALGDAIAFLAFDQNFVDIAGVKIANRAFDQIGFLVHQAGRGGIQCQLANLIPEPQQIFIIALDFGFRALTTGGAHDNGHVLWYVQAFNHLLQALSVDQIGDLAADTAAARRVWHQHTVPTGQRQEGGQRRALVAALLLDHLDQHDLPAGDDFLNPIATMRGAP